jgi:hypothetical protein
LRRSLTRLRSGELGPVRLAFHPCSQLQGIQAKANKISYFKNLTGGPAQLAQPMILKFLQDHFSHIFDDTD